MLPYHTEKIASHKLMCLAVKLYSQEVDVHDFSDQHSDVVYPKLGLNFRHSLVKTKSCNYISDINPSFSDNLGKFFWLRSICKVTI